jgi:hypothetical protein
METLLDTEIAVGKQTQTINFPPLNRRVYRTPASDAYRDVPLPPFPSTDPDVVRIRALDVVSGPYSAEDDDNEKLCALLKKELSQNKKVVLSLKGMTPTTIFYAEVLGTLYEELPCELLDKNLSVVDIPGAGDVLIKRAVRMGKLYQYDRPKHDRIIESFIRTIEEYT